MEKKDYSKFIFNVPSSIDFADALADYLMQDYDFQNVNNDLILLPTRRACRRLSKILTKKICDKFFVDYAILPKIIPVGDIDEDDVLQVEAGDFVNVDFAKLINEENIPDEISYVEKITLLSRLIKQKASSANNSFENISWDQAFKISATLSKFIDTMNNEELDFDNLKNIVPENLEQHWQDVLKFLEIIRDYWNKISDGKIDGSKRRVLTMKNFSDVLKVSQNYRKIVVAGSTGSMPFTRYLMKSILDINFERRPDDSEFQRNGILILPGLDAAINDSVWNNISPVHPQYNFKVLLNYLGVNRIDIKNLSFDFARDLSVEKFAYAISVPSDSTSVEWSKITEDKLHNDVLKKVVKLQCKNQYDEAMSIAFAVADMMHTKPGCKSMIICQDRSIVKNIISAFNRFGISYDDSAGEALNWSAFGESFLLIGRLVNENFSPVSMQSFLRNLFFNFDFHLMENIDEIKVIVDWVEEKLLRGERLYSDDESTHPIRLLIEKKLHRLREEFVEYHADIDSFYPKNILNFEEKLLDFFEEIIKKTTPLYNLRLQNNFNFFDGFNAHLSAFKSFVNFENIDLESLAEFNKFVQMITSTDKDLFDKMQFNFDEYLSVVEMLMMNFMVRKKYTDDVDTAIVGPIEARMQMADFVVIAGLNEGIFPKETETDPWMSRPMREKFGLPVLEKKIGLASHDFVQFLCSAKKIMLTSSVKIGGVESISSRLLFRFETVAKKAELNTDTDFENRIKYFVKNIDYIDEKKSYGRPNPKPKLSSRPTALSATTIEKLIQDPYVVYASHILKLKKIPGVDEDFTNKDFGSLIHKSVQIFIENGWMKSSELYEEICRQFLKNVGYDLYLLKFWDARFKKISEDFVIEFFNDKKNITKSFSEINGEFLIENKFTVKARADRIDILNDGCIRIVDYKSGKIPQEKNIISGKNSQMIIESLIAKYGAFESDNVKVSGNIDSVKYYALSGVAGKGDTVSYDKNYVFKTGEKFSDVLADTYQGIKKMFYDYSKFETAYIAEDEDEKFKSDYEYFKRYKEWKE